MTNVLPIIMISRMCAVFMHTTYTIKLILSIFLLLNVKYNDKIGRVSNHITCALVKIIDPAEYLLNSHFPA